MKPFTCASCGKQVKLLAKPGRKFTCNYFRDIDIPANFVMPTCENCGEYYFTGEQDDEICKLENKLFLSRQNELLEKSIQALCEKNNCKVNDVRFACYQTPSEFKQYREGTKRAPLSLLALLESYVANNDEFLRQLAKMKS